MRKKLHDWEKFKIKEEKKWSEEENSEIFFGLLWVFPPTKREESKKANSIFVSEARKVLCEIFRSEICQKRETSWSREEKKRRSEIKS